MNSCNIIQAQAKSMKSPWSSSRGGGGGRVKFVGAKKCSSNNEEINSLVVLAVFKALKMNKKSKVKTMDDPELENELDHFHF